jgi:hypothetical protein
MEISARALSDRRIQLIAELEQAIGKVNMIRGAIAECDTMTAALSVEVVSQEEMDKVATFPASDSR